MSEQVKKLEARLRMAEVDGARYVEERNKALNQRDEANRRMQTAETRAQKVFTEYLAPVFIDSAFGIDFFGTTQSKADLENEKLRAEIEKLKACSICDAVERRSTLLVAENAALTKAVSDLKAALESAEARSKIYKQAWRTSIQALDNG